MTNSYYLKAYNQILSKVGAKQEPSFYKIGPEPDDREFETITKTASSATWAKLKDGSWGVRVTSQSGAGQSIQVTKKSGEKSTVMLVQLIWTDNATVCLYSVGAAKTGLGSATKTWGSSSSSKYRVQGKECAECGETIKKPGQNCWETGGTCFPG